MKDETVHFRFLTTVYDRNGYSLASVPTNTRERADWLRKWWPHKAETKDWKSKGTRGCLVSVLFTERRAEDVKVWTHNSQLALILLNAWERTKKGRAGRYMDYTLGCLCGGKSRQGSTTEDEVCSLCLKKARVKPYAGPWNPPGGIQAVKNVGRVDIKQILKDPQKRKKLVDQMEAGVKSVPMDRTRPVFKPATKEVRCDIRVVNRYEEDFTIPIERGTEFGNPYKVKDHGRAEALRLYEVHARKKLMKAIEDIPPWAVLGCVCKPKPCHGDIIVKLWKEIHRIPASPEKKPKEPKKPKQSGWNSLL